MHILLGDSITHAQVDAAERMLLDFHALLPELYGEASCTANAHLLTHLTKYVRLWGPLWTHSAFGFETHSAFGLKARTVNSNICFTASRT